MKHIYILFFILLVSFSCKNKGELQPAIILSFDDDHIESWYKARSLFKKYDAKVTFFISRPQKLNKIQLWMLKQLENDGNEIACHTLNHSNIKLYIDSFGEKKYVNIEIDSCITILRKSSFKITSFAYPLGLDDKKIIEHLKSRFTFQRGSIYNKNKCGLDKLDNIFIQNKHQYYSESMGIDINFGNTFERIKSGIDRCLSNNEIMLINAHKILDSNASEYQIEIKALDSIFSYSKRHNIRFIRCSDLTNN